MTSRLYVRKGGDSGAGSIELTSFTGRKGSPFFDQEQSLIELGERCAMGEASQGTFKVMDPDAELPRTDFDYNLPAHALVTWTEDAPGNEIWLARGRVSSYEGGRGVVLVDNEVDFDATFDDGNMELRGQAFTEEWARGSETDVARLLALQAYTLNGFSSTATDSRGTCEVTVRTDHLTPNTNTITMPAKTYPVGTQPQDVVQDCADTAGKIYGVVIHHEGVGSVAPEVDVHDLELGIIAGGPDPVLFTITQTNQLLIVYWGRNQLDGTPTLEWAPDVSDSGEDQSLTKLFESNVLSVWALWNPTPTIDNSRVQGAWGGGTSDRAMLAAIVVDGYTSDPTAGFTFDAGTAVGTTATNSITAGAGDLVLAGLWVNNESVTMTADEPGQTLLDWDGAQQWGGATSEQPGAGGTTTSTFTYTGSDHGNSWRVIQTVLPALDTDLQSHLCLFYTVETDHDTYPSVVKISDHLDEWDPTSLTAPVFEPHWEAGKATIYDGQRNLSGLVSIFGDNDSVFVENTSDITAYDYWVDSFYDSQSVDATQAGDRASGVLTYRRLTQVTHRVSIIMQPQQMHLVTAGMSLVIKAAAAMGGQYLDIDQTRRIVEHRFEPRHDGTYWAHLNLDRTPHRRVPVNGTGGSGSQAMQQATAVGIELDTHVTDPTDAHAASTLSFTPTGSIAATDVQAAIEEVASEADGGSISAAHLLSSITFPIVAHRGDMNPVDGYPENTIEALRQAMTKGAHGVEFDVLRDSQSVWQVIHDTTVDRTTDGTGAVSSKTTAQMAALNIDAGHGYDAGRHSTTLNVPTLDEAIEVMLPYDPILYFDLKESATAAHEALATYIVANDLVERSVLLGLTVAGLQAAHVIAPTLEMEIPAVVDDDPQTYDYIDRVLSEQAVVTNAAYVQTREPDPVDSYIDADSHYGDDETTYLTNMWDRGVRVYLTNDLPGALAIRNEIVLGISPPTGLASWASYTPTLTGSVTNPTLGSSTITGRYKALDANTYAINIALTITTGGAWNAGSGDWIVSLPSVTSAAYRQTIAAHISDAGTRRFVATGVIGASATTIGATGVADASGTFTLGAAIPITWATNDYVLWSGTIEVA